MIVNGVSVLGGYVEEEPTSPEDHAWNEAKIKLGLAGVPDDELGEDAVATVTDLAKQYLPKR